MMAARAWLSASVEKLAHAIVTHCHPFSRSNTPCDFCDLPQSACVDLAAGLPIQRHHTASDLSTPVPSRRHRLLRRHSSAEAVLRSGRQPMMAATWAVSATLWMLRSPW